MKALILGVGSAQIDAILFLKATGHHVTGISYRREGPGVALVDEFFVIDITDKGEVLKFAEATTFDLIYSVGSDVAMPTVSFVSKHLGLPRFFDEGLANLLQNKLQFREFQRRADLVPISTRKLSSAEDAAGWDTFPAIIKPVDSQGQRGVYEVGSQEEIRLKIESALAPSRTSTAILEEYINGPELSVNALFNGAKLHFMCISSRLVVEGFPGGIVRGHHTPVELPGRLHENIVKLVEKLAAAVELTQGPLYLQLKYVGEEPYIIEAAPRLDGCHLWKLIEKSTGINLLQLVFKQLAGESITELQPHQHQTHWMLEFFLSPPGQPFFEHDHPSNPDSKEIVYYYRDGEIVKSINGHMEKVGYQIYALQ